jgi:hypothetical protein
VRPSRSIVRRSVLNAPGLAKPAATPQASLVCRRGAIDPVSAFHAHVATEARRHGDPMWFSSVTLCLCGP